MKIISMYFPNDNITTLINESFRGLDENADVSSFNILSTTSVGDGVLIIVEAFENDEKIKDIIAEAIHEGFNRSLDNIKLNFKF